MREDRGVPAPRQGLHDVVLEADAAVRHSLAIAAPGDLLILLPAILNLDTTAPDKMTAGRSRQPSAHR